MPLNGKVALVTGGSRGIGAEIAKQLSAEGARIFLVAQDSDEMFENVARQCRAQFATADVKFARIDFLAENASPAVIRAATAAFGRIDILVNNAAIRVRRPFGEFSAKEFDDVVGVNLRAPFLLSQEVVPVMKQNGGGRIINIASQMGSIAEQNLTLYGLTKAALIHLTRQLANELGPTRVVGIAPGLVKTDFAKVLVDNFGEQLERSLPTKRLGEPEDIANLAVFLASDRASWMTGETYVIDGGAGVRGGGTIAG